MVHFCDVGVIQADVAQLLRRQMANVGRLMSICALPQPCEKTNDTPEFCT